MKISIFGLGYVGAVTAACLARDGHHVIGVDLNPEKVALIARGESPIVEPGLSDLLQEGVNSGRIQATMDTVAAIANSEISLISVGTPPMERGEPDLCYVLGVCKDIALEVKRKNKPQVILLVDQPQKALEQSDLIVVTHRTPEFQQLVQEAREETQIFDLVGIFDEAPKQLQYQGLAW